MEPYDHKKIEAKWQKIWDERQENRVAVDPSKPKYYCLIEFPYPSGEGLHVGHIRSNTAMDIIARKRRAEGFNVLYPIGWDAFGLPTENYAIKTGIQPAVVTKNNSDIFRRQLKSLGFSFDWSREINTTDPRYYKWTQWIFLQLFQKGLAYKKKMMINWCPKDLIGLANEEVVNGCCERCGTPVEKKEKEQWMLAITKYADRLDKDLDTVDYLPRIKTQQRNWIGRSEGINFKEKVKDLGIEFEVYDSIPQTFLAQTFTVIAPEHLMVQELVKGTPQEKEVMEFVARIAKKKTENRFDVENDLEGVFTGRYVENPFGTGDLPIWVASYVVADYGTGIVNCSAHDGRDFAFAKKYNIPLKIALLPKDKKLAEKVKNLEIFYREPDGLIQSPAEFSGLTWTESRGKIIDYIVAKGYGKKTTHYKLRDWVFSRQHYWGEPIPLVYCEKDGWVPVVERDLPVTLPTVERYQPSGTGESPLATIADWVKVKCPKCGGPAKRETDTMPNWAGSSWYYLRYCDPQNDQELASRAALDYFTPVDWYNGGMEHTTLHLLYSRFWHKFLFDLGLVPTNEPYQKRTSHGMILAENGEKMSKSRGNVINPDKLVELYGADTLRLYEMFMGPFDQAIAWSTESLMGPRRFLEKVWRLGEKVQFPPALPASGLRRDSETGLSRLLHQTIKKVGEDIEEMHFNTAVSALMILVAQMEKEKEVSREDYKILLQLLAPFAPHVAEELWEKVGGVGSISSAPWPKYKENELEKKEWIIIVQVNGIKRDAIIIPAGTSEEEIKKTALDSPKTAKWLEGKKVKKIVHVSGKLINIVV